SIPFGVWVTCFAKLLPDAPENTVPSAKPTSAADQYLAVASVARDAAGHVDGGGGRHPDGRRGVWGDLRGAVQRHRQPAAEPGSAFDRQRIVGGRPRESHWGHHGFGCQR